MGETMTPVRDSIEAKLTEAFAPEALEIIDESEKHRHHGHGIEGGETHFKVVMRAPAFNGMSRVARSRAVHGILEQELAGRVHALSLDLTGTQG